MAITEINSTASDLVNAPAQSVPRGVRVGVHDASRVEWSFSVPLPEDRPLSYKLRVRMQIPSIVRQAPWEQLQSFTRLDGPMLTSACGAAITIDSLRRGALAIVAKLSRANDAFARHCRLVHNQRARASVSDVEETLSVWLEAAERIVTDGRERFAVAVVGEAPELSRERELLDEYTSVRLLETLAVAERALSRLSTELGASSNLQVAIAAVESRIVDTLARELAHRREADYLVADPSSSSALERYLERSSRLKKHFQEVLFLEAETFQVAERIQHWTAALAAVVAGSFAFVVQVGLTTRGSTGSQVSSGLVILALIGGVCYAFRDRLKDYARV